MRIVVTGSSGHLGEGLMRTLVERGHDAVGLDIRKGPFTSVLGSITEREVVRSVLDGADSVIHAATLHKPHIATHSRHDFVETNVVGTLNLLEESVAAGLGSFIFTSTTSTFGRALMPDPGAPAAWIDESVTPLPKNIYGVTKVAAENLCELFHHLHALPCIILRTSRFFPDEDDRHEVRGAYADENIKANEYLYRRVDLSDAVQAHLLALEEAERIGFERYIVSATTPFTDADLADIRADAPGVVAQLIPEFPEVYEKLGWRMFPGVDRVYVNEKARRELGWEPLFDFRTVLSRANGREDIRSDLARAVGLKRYHSEEFADGLYPVKA